MEFSSAEKKDESPYFPATPEGTPPAIQIKRALEEKANNEESPYFPATPEGTPPAIQIQRALEEKVNN